MKKLLYLFSILLLVSFVSAEYIINPNLERIGDTKNFLVDTYTPCYGNVQVLLTSESGLPDNEYIIPNCDKVDNYRWNCSCNGSYRLQLDTNPKSDTFFNIITEHYLSQNDTYEMRRNNYYNNISIYRILYPPPPPKPKFNWDLNVIIMIVVGVFIGVIILCIIVYYIMRALLSEKKEIKKVFIAEKTPEQIQKEYDAIMGKFK